jgi:hypothetical protein
MSLNSQHPAYARYYDQWIQLRDFYKGEEHVKLAEDKYLLPTAGMTMDGMGANDVGRQAYESYLSRAVFPDYIKDAVEISIGLLHQKEAVIELPPELEVLRDDASIKGESLNQLLRRINVEQLITGRCGLLLDTPIISDPTNPVPYIALYIAESIINWDESNDSIDTDKINMVIMDETGYRRVNKLFDWQIMMQYRILILDDNGTYKQGVFNNDTGTNYDESLLITPAIRGKSLKELPFVFINSKDLLPLPENSPLLGLANITAAIYRGEADYRYSLFMQGQDTLVVIGSVRNPNLAPGGDDAIRTGAGSRIDIDVTGDAKYIGVSSKGLAEQRTCLENDRKRAETHSGRLIGTKSNVESGEALRVRIGAQTATLNQIAITSALALEKILKIAARWIGADDSKVRVIPNMDFADIDFQGQELVNIMTARNMGAPISLESIHNVLVDRGMTNFDFETEMAKIPVENKDANIPTPDAGTKIPAQPNQTTKPPQPKVGK